MNSPRLSASTNENLIKTGARAGERVLRNAGAAIGGATSSFATFERTRATNSSHEVASERTETRQSFIDSTSLSGDQSGVLKPTIHRSNGPEKAKNTPKAPSVPVLVLDEKGDKLIKNFCRRYEKVLSGSDDEKKAALDYIYKEIKSSDNIEWVKLYANQVMSGIASLAKDNGVKKAALAKLYSLAASKDTKVESLAILAMGEVASSAKEKNIKKVALYILKGFAASEDTAVASLANRAIIQVVRSMQGAVRQKVIQSVS